MLAGWLGLRTVKPREGGGYTEKKFATYGLEGMGIKPGMVFTARRKYIFNALNAHVTTSGQDMDSQNDNLWEFCGPEIFCLLMGLEWNRKVPFYCSM